MKSATELITDIDEITKSIKDNPESLSTAVVELAQKNTGLGNWLAQAQEAERALDRDLKIARNRVVVEGRKADGKKAVGALEAEALLGTEELWSELVEVQNAVGLYKIKRNDVQTLIDSLRSRLAVIRNDMRNENGV